MNTILRIVLINSYGSTFVLTVVSAVIMSYTFATNKIISGISLVSILLSKIILLRDISTSEKKQDFSLHNNNKYFCISGLTVILNVCNLFSFKNDSTS